MTDSFLGLDQEVSKCDEGERQGDCRSRSYLRAVEERCGCVPSSLKQLARLVVRGFYDIEYSLIVDMLVRYHLLRSEPV